MTIPNIDAVVVGYESSEKQLDPVAKNINPIVKLAYIPDPRQKLLAFVSKFKDDPNE